MKKLLLGLGTITAITAPIAATVGCQIFGGSKKAEETTKKIKLEDGQRIYSIWFAIGVKKENLIVDPKTNKATMALNADFKKSLKAAYLPDESKVSLTITPTTFPGFTGSIESYINFIWTGSAKDTPSASSVGELIKRQFKKGGIDESAFLFAASTGHYKDITTDAKALNEDGFVLNGCAIDDLKGIKFVHK